MIGGDEEEQPLARGLDAPEFGDIVGAGALAGAIPTPAQLAQQTLALSSYLSDQGTRPPWPPALVAYARPISVYVNPNVAQRLGMTLPDTKLLAERVNAAP